MFQVIISLLSLLIRFNCLNHQLSQQVPKTLALKSKFNDHFIIDTTLSKFICKQIFLIKYQNEI